MMFCFRLYIIWTGFVSSLALEIFRARIPNGDRVPNSCDANGAGSIWNGVGHYDYNGGGKRNPFGQDFERLGKNWSVELCNLDSDSDGKSNGIELGDPHCVWKVGEKVHSSSKLSHPGICEPVNTEKCKKLNSGICDRKTFDCPAIDSQDVKNVTLHFSEMRVPAKVTTYICMDFRLEDFGLDTNKTYHIVATSPLVDNYKILHHMIYYKCDPRFQVKTSNEPYICDMAPSRECNSMIGAWTFGSMGDCYHPSVGFRLGKGGFTEISMQLHWHNPSETEGLYDASGMLFYYTESLRENDAAVLSVGREKFVIPPKQDSFLLTATCQPICMQNVISSTVYIVNVFNHMHYLGRSMKTVLRRNGKVVEVFASEKFEYDNPKFHTFEPPIAVSPDDELKVYCNYSSRSKTTETVWGENTADEMCYSFMTIYPARNLRKFWCTEPYLCNPHEREIQGMSNELSKACRPTKCLTNTCPNVVRKWRGKQFIEEYKTMIFGRFPKIWNLFRSCDATECPDKQEAVKSGDERVFSCSIEDDTFLRVAESLERRCSFEICKEGCKEAIGIFWNHSCLHNVPRADVDEIMSEFYPYLYAELHSCDVNSCIPSHSPSTYPSRFFIVLTISMMTNLG